MIVILIVLLVIIVLMVYSISFLYKVYVRKNLQYNKTMRNFLMLYDWMELKQGEQNAVVTRLWQRL